MDKTKATELDQRIREALADPSAYRTHIFDFTLTTARDPETILDTFTGTLRDAERHLSWYHNANNMYCTVLRIAETGEGLVSEGIGFPF